jgi:hypothetical protein
MHAGPVTCLSVSDDQLILSGSSLGSITVSGILSDQRVATLRSTDLTGCIVFLLCQNLFIDHAYILFSILLNLLIYIDVNDNSTIGQDLLSFLFLYISMIPQNGTHSWAFYVLNFPFYSIQLRSAISPLPNSLGIA